MTEQQATYTAAKEINPDEQVTYTTIGKGVYAVHVDGFPELIAECHTSKWLGITQAKACQMAERIAKMLNGQAI